MQLILGLLLFVTAVQSQSRLRPQPPLPVAQEQPVPVRPFQPGIPKRPIPNQPILGQPIPGRPIPGQPIPGQRFPGQPLLVNSQTFDTDEENTDIPISSESPSARTTISPESITLGRRSPRPGILRKITRTRPMMKPTESYADDEFQVSTESSDISDEEEPDHEVTTPVNRFLLLTKNLQFDCSIYSPGFYANVETNCSIWHYCHGDIRYDNMCPDQTAFNQEYLTCMMAAESNCSQAPNFYDRNKLLYMPVTTNAPLRKIKRRRRTTTPPPTQDYVYQPDEQ